MSEAQKGIEPLTPDAAERFRKAVRDRLTHRNLIAVAFASVGALFPLGYGIAGLPYTGWPLAIFMFSAPAGLVMWHVRAGCKPETTCPNCGDSWEYDAFLRDGACETCGLTLPPREG